RPENHDVPKGMSLSTVRRLPEEFYELQVTKTLYTPRGELKPNAKVLLDIIGSVGSDPARTVYVGDSLFKDVTMAKAAGVLDIHAKYGESQRREEYNLLRKVTHWTDEDVERERR